MNNKKQVSKCMWYMTSTASDGKTMENPGKCGNCPGYSENCIAYIPVDYIDDEKVV